jgi:hypothetical protein
MSISEVVTRDVTRDVTRYESVRGILVMVRCDAHIGEAHPPRCTACTALVFTAKTSVVPLAPPVPVWAKTIDNKSEGEAGR